MADAPQPEAPKPGFLKLAVTMFEHDIEVGIAEARLLLHQGLARDRAAAEAAIEQAAADLRAHHAAADSGPSASAPAPTVSATGQATAPDGGKAKETT